ncbi:MAG: hypothetical protein DLM59_03135 [Pseudonocardiales bacterium]|nr:MAG: hypothetical protein DLM59_03135 [Pseudonocardiales bacterium]
MPPGAAPAAVRPGTAEAGERPPGAVVVVPGAGGGSPGVAGGFGGGQIVLKAMLRGLRELPFWYAQPSVSPLLGLYVPAPSLLKVQVPLPGALCQYDQKCVLSTWQSAGKPSMEQIRPDGARR